MRPVRLELEGFAAFRERGVLEFDGLDLVAFTGATGAGKSTLIDAITFALFGQVARYADARRIAPVVHQLANEAKVRLDFETGGRTYIVTRVVRRIGGSGADKASTREARLERVEELGPDGRPALTSVLAGDVKTLNPAIEELLGLDFGQFTRTIVLPQGEFAAFLRDEPANRERLLQRLLDLGIYERMGQLARARASELATRISVHEEHRGRLQPPSEVELSRLELRWDGLKRFRSLVADGVGAVSDIEAALRPLREQTTAIDRSRDRLAAIEIPPGLANLDRDLAEAVEARSAVEAELAEARQLRNRTQAELDRLPDKADLAKGVSMAKALAEARTELAELEAEAVELEPRQVELMAEVARLDEELAAAEETLRSARQSADAAQWRATLEPGRPCPVCRREVESVPDHNASRELDEAEEHHRRLAAEARDRSKEATRTDERMRVVTAEVERYRDRLELLDLQRSTLPALTPASGPDGPPSSDPDRVRSANEDLEAWAAAAEAAMAEVDAAAGRNREAIERAGALEDQRDAAVRRQEEVQAAAQRLERRLAEVRQSVADLDPPVPDHRSLVDDFEALALWAGERLEALAGERAEVAAEGKRLSQEKSELLGRLVDAGTEVGVTGEVDDLPAVAARAEAEAEQAVVSARRRRAEADELAARIGELETERVVDEALGRHLRAGGFARWLLAEALDNIVGKASGWLLELSNRQYSLVAGDGTFAIVDHNNADEIRNVRTLSGGETFLASLSLALALADSIGELAPVDSPRLDSMFLDEGFGTLDPATLDVVAGAIEELASSGRMIGIVTHVGDLAERLPARFEVTKGPTTSRVELVSQ